MFWWPWKGPFIMITRFSIKPWIKFFAVDGLVVDSISLVTGFWQPFGLGFEREHISQLDDGSNYNFKGPRLSLLIQEDDRLFRSRDIHSSWRSVVIGRPFNPSICCFSTLLMHLQLARRIRGAHPSIKDLHENWWFQMNGLYDRGPYPIGRGADALPRVAFCRRWLFGITHSTPPPHPLHLSRRLAYGRAGPLQGLGVDGVSLVSGFSDL